jgi:hypothetical protein
MVFYRTANASIAIITDYRGDLWYASAF